MTPNPLKIARKRIKECSRTRSPELDLSGLGLDEIPEEVFKLTWLEKLDLSDNYISDLLSLNDLRNLQVFNFNDGKIDRFILMDLPQLQRIDCNDSLIEQLTLNDLPQLQQFNCRHSMIKEVTLSDLPILKSIDFSGLFLESHVVLKNLLQLQQIYCSNSMIEQLTLSDLPQLQKIDCNTIPIKQLTLNNLLKLETLDCSNSWLVQLTLNKLPKLQTLDCSRNNINQLNLFELPNLKILNCSNNQINKPLPIYNIVSSSQLNELYLYDNPIMGIPSILLGDWLDNCLDDIKNYWKDLANGSEKQQQLKVQLVGNGRVGKTTLAYALEHKRAPNELFKSTHGIIIKEVQQALDGGDESVTLQLWDFGGQEIYHATHRLFLSDDCLYLLLWAEETEEHQDETRHPVSYWLELINDLGKSSPVILVKNQIDLADRLPTRPPKLTDDMPGVSQIRQEVKISAMQYRGMPTLRGAIESVIEELKCQVCLELPTSWLQVQRELKQLNQKTIPFAHFKQLCIKAGIDHAEWFVDYLHKTGVLFYRKGAFQDQIILDQNWIIEAVYRVFDPQNQRSFIEDDLKGYIKGRNAKIVWPEVEETEREIYLDFMRNCGICYEPNHRYDTPFAERTFIIPALLPKDKPACAAGRKHDMDWQLDVEYPFLHRSIIERIILRLGEAYHSTPWRYGIVCEIGEHEQILLMERDYTHQPHSNQGLLHFKLSGNQLDRLVYALRKLVSQTSPHRRYTEYLSKGTEERVHLEELKEGRESTSRLDDTKPADKTIKLFISYSHADEPHKLRLEKHLKAISRTLPLTAWSDRHLFAGESVDEQIFQQLDTADIVLLMVSPDFINSDYCFTKEMKRALQRYNEAGSVVIPVIIRHTSSWRNHAIGQITALPKDGKPLAKWDDEDEFWGSVEDGIRDQVKKLLKT